ncbi:unnamed protein product, partial [Sphacelaria rigidula]
NFSWTRSSHLLSFSPFLKVVPIGTAENRYHGMIFTFSRTSCRRLSQGKTPENCVAKLDQLIPIFTCSRKGRPKNAVFILKSSSLRFHRGRAKFIALERKTSR